MLSVLVCFSSNLSSYGPVFDFRKFCLFCAKPCSIMPDEQHPHRWEKDPGIVCKTGNKKIPGTKSPKFLRSSSSGKFIKIKYCNFEGNRCSYSPINFPPPTNRQLTYYL